MNTYTITLGGKEYEVRQLPIRKNTAWRSKLRAPYEEVVKLLSFFDLDMSDPEVVKTGFDQIVTRLGDQAELLLDLLYEYSDTLAADKEHIEENATEDEVLAAFLAVLKKVFPVDFLASALSEVQKIGFDPRQITTNSRLQLGASTPTTSTK